MKIFLTIEFVALLISSIGWARDINYRHNYHSSDGGWTTYYTYSERLRSQAYKLSAFAGCLAITGVLFLIWSN